MNNLSNNEIVEIVYRTYNLQDLIKKLIAKSVNDNSFKDLESYIYLKILQMDNYNLNRLYLSGSLNRYICQIIKNQRNIKWSEYSKYFKINDNITADCLQDFIMIDEDDRIEYIYSELERYESSTGLTAKEEGNRLAYTFFKYYLRTEKTMKQISDEFPAFNFGTIQYLIDRAKKNLKLNYDDYTDDDII